MHVHLFDELLAETLKDDEARAWLLERAAITGSLRAACEEMDPEALARTLVGGITKRELASPSAESLRQASAVPDDFFLRPRPNHLFTRDTSCWVFDGVTVNPMAKPARRRESLHVEAVYRFHPLFAGRDIPRWLGLDDPGVTLEGGDVHAPRHRADHGRHRRVHPLPRAAPAVREDEHFFADVGDLLGLPRVRVLQAQQDVQAAEREQWDDGNTCSLSRPALSSPTSATSQPTRCCASMASR